MKEGDSVVEQYGNLRGQDALDQRQSTLDRLDEIRSRNVSQLAPYQQHAFDQTWRAYQDRLWAGKIATHSIQQGYGFGKEQNVSTLERANKLAADNYNDPAIVENAKQQARGAIVKQLQLDGQAHDADSVARALDNSDAQIYKSAAEALAVHHPDAAARYIDEHQKDLGEHYAVLAEKFRARADEIKNTNTANNIHDDVVNGPGVAPVAPFTPSNVVQFPAKQPAERPKGWDFVTKPQGAAPTKAGPNTRAEIQIESGGVPQYGGHYAGLGQFSPDEQKRYGITNPNDRRQVETALKLEANEFKPALSAALGHEPEPFYYYLAHQQGVAGAVNHIKNPDRPAWENMRDTAEGRAKGLGWAKRAIWGNMSKEMRKQFPGGVDTVTSGAFVRLWATRHDQIANRLAASEE